jgi:glycosyltransferase involved in cell wall biosynthesis
LTSVDGPGRLPGVSVVIPALDDAPALETCLRRIAVQTVRPVEVIVVDNGSTDDTAAVALAHGAVVLREPIPGIPAAAATGYDAATAEVLVRCDADTRPGRRWLERLVRPLTDPRLDAVTGVGWFYDLPRGLRWSTAAAYLGSYYLLSHLALGHTALWGSNMAVRRAAWVAVRDAVHRADPEVHDDMDLAFALGPARRIRLVPTAVGVSARSLRGREQRRRRIRRARRTLALNWAVAPPWLRWRDRFTTRSSARSAVG